MPTLRDMLIEIYQPRRGIIEFPRGPDEGGNALAVLGSGAGMGGGQESSAERGGAVPTSVGGFTGAADTGMRDLGFGFIGGDEFGGTGGRLSELIDRMDDSGAAEGFDGFGGEIDEFPGRNPLASLAAALLPGPVGTVAGGINAINSARGLDRFMDRLSSITGKPVNADLADLASALTGFNLSPRARGVGGYGNLGAAGIENAIALEDPGVMGPARGLGRAAFDLSRGGGQDVDIGGMSPYGGGGYDAAAGIGGMSNYGGGGYDAAAGAGGPQSAYGGGGYDAARGGGGSGGGAADRDNGRGGGGGGFGCFVAGTPVLMADRTEKPIEQIEAGDEVMAFDGLGALEPRKVAKTMRHEDCDTLEMADASGHTILTTAEHPFLMPDGVFKAAGQIVAGDALVTADGGTIVVAATYPSAGRETVYNFEVGELHTYVAGGVRVHNIKHMGGMISEDRVPGMERGDVPETLQEGEYVITADAVEMFGPEFFGGLNKLAGMMRQFHPRQATMHDGGMVKKDYY